MDNVDDIRSYSIECQNSGELMSIKKALGWIGEAISEDFNLDIEFKYVNYSMRYTHWYNSNVTFNEVVDVKGFEKLIKNKKESTVSDNIRSYGITCGNSNELNKLEKWLDDNGHDTDFNSADGEFFVMFDKDEEYWYNSESNRLSGVTDITFKEFKSKFMIELLSDGLPRFETVRIDIKNKKENDMNEMPELKSGMIVEFENKKRCNVVDVFGDILIADCYGSCKLEECSKEAGDIVAVFKPKHQYFYPNAKDWFNAQLDVLWRKTNPMTIAEAEAKLLEFGVSVKIK